MTASKHAFYPQDNRPKWEAVDTSRRHVILAIGLGLITASATSSMPIGTGQAFAQSLQARQTNAGYTHPEERAAANNIAKLRAISGLTWEQLGYLLNTSRRSVHLWANGNAIAAQNEERLARTLSTIESISRGAPSLNRALLLSPIENGKLIIDLLREERYPVAIEAAQRLAEVKIQSTNHLGPKRHAWRTEYVGALNDEVHLSQPQTRLSRSIKAKA
jgi:DNA-binding transcriptional regulator YiaG